MSEVRRSFDCFGGSVSVAVFGPDSMRPEEAATRAEERLLAAHGQLSRFILDSDLNRLNRDPRTSVPSGPLLLKLARAVREAGELSEGLVDATLLREVEVAGYRDSIEPGSGGDAPAPATTTPAAPSPERSWAKISVDAEAGTVERPPGVEIDSGGVAKGMLADEVAASLEEFPAYAVDCCGDVRIGGRAGRPRRIRVEDPFGEKPIHSLRVASGGIATSGITRRSWVGEDGVLAHHLIDPATGSPAFTGVVQATALAPTAFLADVYAKWALLSGPETGLSRLPHGGVLVLADGSVATVPAPSPIATAA